MSVEFYRESPGSFDSRTLSRETLNRWTGRSHCDFSATAIAAAAARARGRQAMIIIISSINTITIAMNIIITIITLLLLFNNCLHFSILHND